MYNPLLLVDSVDAFGSVPTRVRHALVNVYLAVRTGRTGPTTALISVYQILARAAVLTGRGRALVQLVLAQQSRVARVTRTSERVLAVDTLAVLARIRQTVVDVVLAIETRESRRTLALVTGN